VLGGKVLQGILYGVLFLICVAACASLRSQAARQGILLVSSYILYLTWGPWFALALVASTITNFLLGRWLRRKPTGTVLATGILLNLALLGSFKYLPDAALHSSFPLLQPLAHLALPLGISFWTFQAMSYLFDLYRGEELDPSFVEFALYMVFFPVAISGPICRMPEMLPQFRARETTRWRQLEQGLRRIATGIFMVQLARLLGQGILGGDGINSGFDRVTHWTGADVWCLAFGYGLQLFLDFAGYSHMAIGAARALGFTLPENFARPFESASPSIFWTRWHMSLSFWIRDYVFLPLATARREVWWRNFALVLSMVIFGLWHRGTVLFLVWGLYHGVLLVLHRNVQQLQRRWNWEPGRLGIVVGWIGTMALVSLGWILFRANSLTEAGQMLSAVISPASYANHALSTTLYILVAGIALGYALAIWVIDTVESQHGEMEAGRRRELIAVIARWRWYWLPPLYGLALLLLLFVTLTRGATAAQFMYNKF
jgi:alginate O-acetyltransferase complex protein AlgI